MDDIFELIEFVQFANEDNAPKRYIRDQENPVELFSDLQFYKRYRYSKEIVIDIIMPLITIHHNNNRGLPIPPILQLLTTLRFYAFSNFQIVNDELREINQGTVSRIIKNISKMLASNVKNHVHFPRNIDEWNIIKVKFYQMYKMPRIGGCIDCTHIQIQNPGSPDSEVFRNRKGYFSLNVQ
ncbi:PREDICTED: putative nuclease HARBI1, partial [Diuraphis noxia]|uniref:putative nuclease HARBI1 n=1 Tax=Diuraphis noxia TaxID=143948 RepID=UPI0007637A26